MQCKKLSELLDGVSVLDVIGDSNIEILNLSIDSRKCTVGGGFFAFIGENVDGNAFIENAISNGCVAIFTDVKPSIIHDSVTYIILHDVKHYAGTIIGNFFDNPSKHIKVVAITGTSGKTSTSVILYNTLIGIGVKVGLMSTYKICVGSEEYPPENTTPSVLNVHKYLHDMVCAGCEYCILEVSSHAIVQGRISGVKIIGAICTNISSEHLEFHKTFEDYVLAKQKLFNDLPKTSFALYNADDNHSRAVVEKTKASMYSFAFNSVATFRAKCIISPHGTSIKINRDNDYWVGDISSIHETQPAIGDHKNITANSDYHGVSKNSNTLTITNGQLLGFGYAYNMLACFSVCSLLGFRDDDIRYSMSTLSPIPGRFQMVNLDGINVIVDNAHKTGALDYTLKSIKSLSNGGRIIVVIGCGGERDKTKRPAMTRIAYDISDMLILTSDNPRSENVEDIISDMKSGLSIQEQCNTITIPDRRCAINEALTNARDGDFVLIAGRGSENFQEIYGVKYPLNDMSVVLEFRDSHATSR